MSLFGGYVAWVNNGYHFSPFSWGFDNDGDSVFGRSLHDAANVFEISSAMNLPCGRLGYRRDLLPIKNGGGYFVVYSVFIGASEASTSRRGGFISLGLAFSSELIFDSQEVLGKSIQILLNYICGKITTQPDFPKIKNKSNQELEKMAIAVFGERPDLVERIKRIPSKSVMVSGAGKDSGKVLIFLSNEDISGSFDSICAREDVNFGNFFLFEADFYENLKRINSKAFKVVFWPITPASQPIPPLLPKSAKGELGNSITTGSVSDSDSDDSATPGLISDLIKFERTALNLLISILTFVTAVIILMWLMVTVEKNQNKQLVGPSPTVINNNPVNYVYMKSVKFTSEITFSDFKSKCKSFNAGILTLNQIDESFKYIQGREVWIPVECERLVK